MWTGNKFHHGTPPTLNDIDITDTAAKTKAIHKIVTMYIDLEVTSNMSPTSQFLIYYIHDDGETVADSIEFQVAPCLQNKVQYRL